jgi:hypothetical protein
MEGENGVVLYSGLEAAAQATVDLPSKSLLLRFYITFWQRVLSYGL